MTPLPAPALSETAVALCVVFILLVPLAAAGLSLINTGLGRSRSAAHAMLAALCVMAVAAVVYFVCGFSWHPITRCSRSTSPTPNRATSEGST